jgi:hypothetical protein
MFALSLKLKKRHKKTAGQKTKRHVLSLLLSNTLVTWVDILKEGHTDASRPAPV